MAMHSQILQKQFHIVYLYTRSVHQSHPTNTLLIVCEPLQLSLINASFVYIPDKCLFLHAPPIDKTAGYSRYTSLLVTHYTFHLVLVASKYIVTIRHRNTVFRLVALQRLLQDIWNMKTIKSKLPFICFTYWSPHPHDVILPVGQ